MQTTKPGDERRPQRGESEPTQQTPTRNPDDGDEVRYEDPVDEASAQSMIASDPPARSGFRVGPPKKTRRKKTAL